jgi:hypothetical protein
MAFFKMREVRGFVERNENNLSCNSLNFQMFFEDNIDNDKYSGHLFGLSFQTDRTASSE